MRLKRDDDLRGLSAEQLRTFFRCHAYVGFDAAQAAYEQNITNVTDAITLISSVPPGTPLKITVVRDGTERDLTVIVGSHSK